MACNSVHAYKNPASIHTKHAYIIEIAQWCITMYTPTKNQQIQRTYQKNTIKYKYVHAYRTSSTPKTCIYQTKNEARQNHKSQYSFVWIPTKTIWRWNDSMTKMRSENDLQVKGVYTRIPYAQAES